MASEFSLDVLRLRDFRLLLATRIFGMMALQAQDVIIGWQIYSLTHDPFILGLTGLTEAVPAITCALFAGHVVDVGRPHRIFLTCFGVMLLNMCVLLLAAGGYVPVPGKLTAWIFSGVFISGLARSFVMPSSFSLLSRIVPRDKIPAASAWLSGGFQLGAISGPAVAGVMYGVYGVHVVWFMPALLMLGAFIALACMGRPHRQYRSAARREPAAKSIRAGWVFILHNRVLLAIMALDMFAVLFGGAVAMLPAYADKVLHIGSEGLGALRAAAALGAIATALLLALRPMKIMRASLLLWVVAGFGGCIIGFGLSTHFWLSMLFLAASGAFDSVSMVMRSTLMQLLVPDAMRGRVSAVNSMFIISSNEIGAFESGLAAKFLGLVPSVVFGGCMTLLVAGATAFFSPRLRRLRVNADDASVV
jgi:MFS family permease